ncbi:MAG: PQQ-dependent sugar dehydrogenase [Planctomycetota bacterium]|nr:PQQ-dependent sugar dehydrogenase [Planctomycetota bacterium]
MPTVSRILLVALPLLILVLPGEHAESRPAQMPGVRLLEAWPDVEFKEPIDVTSARDGTDFVYVAEQKGTIQRIAKYRGSGAVPRPALFLDIKSRVYAQSQGGLLGIAFHPEHRTNRRLYVSYLAENADAQLKFKLVVSEFRSNGERADPRSERIVLEVPKDSAQHQGGGIRFGPDGMLYIGVGDAKQEDSAQNPRSLYGKMLRIDPTATAGGRAYGIPQGNPWPAVEGVRPEIWGFGFRNPWRFGWDLQGRLYAVEPGTSGAESREWIMQVKYGSNHGWPFMEGTRRLKSPAKPKDFVPSTFEWVRGDGGGTAGIGGTVYRGDRVKALRGKYLFGDYMRGELYCIDLATVGNDPQTQRVVGQNFRLVGEVPEFVGMGEDDQGELYFCSNDMGIIFTMAAGNP